MKWEAHTRTAQKILSDFDAYHFQKYEKDLINGIIYPDSNDPKPHRDRDEAVRNNIRKARDRRLEYNPSDSFFYLGMAFHYIQDSWMGIDPDHEDYTRYEKQIDKSTLLDMGEDLFRYYPVKRNRVLTQFKELDKCLSVPLKNTEEMYALISAGSPFESTAFLDLNLSYRICRRVAEMVLKPMLKTSLDENLSRLHVEYTEKLVSCEDNERESLFLLEENIGKSSQGLLFGVEAWKKRQDLNKKTTLYGNGRHLEKTFKTYRREADALAKPYIDWYNVKIPDLILPLKPEVKAEPVYPLLLTRDDPVIPMM
jgi:hypothetical protein